ncbi:phosphatidylethanolamine N-methyltransferase Cho2 [Schizosaccharomyces cryophilus OY26]|uniref:Phosphatidylethanolamine N-methyltransferase n=1 Tax=Schizosaccharomyces cryophilus (strain OY26 / ATCC MYA-4695 / CBS 11777 / NBRC 106824 / NRRL Y48691) TaxID=653667 RepID=S9X8T7_SCHCR|nr:phosphatidylethanolamine N-methyltransferase Cho2 [Schizosaccharomyces cryophilus OY26]EPY53592.1 phosphatidylethanolamine N-methyltransferase Cho2 [Schizosaccharomyces cryophilus OY26]
MVKEKTLDDGSLSFDNSSLDFGSSLPVSSASSPKKSRENVKLSFPGDDEDATYEESSTSGLDRYGLTPSGETFALPHEQENRRSILETIDPRVPKTPWDWVVIGSILSQVALYLFTRGNTRRVLLMACFFFWRMSYDIGIGFLLHSQSNDRKVVEWVNKLGFLDKKKNPKLYEMTKHQLVSKMDPSYNFEKSPIEFNSWLVFRHFVDLILMCDFCSYVLMAFAWTCWPNMNFLLHMLRFFGGIALIVFNYWVKLDAHRVVRDYAWYWGDFFFLLRSSLVFNGVFELAPHPMYSIGYAGYYGMSLISGSYGVLLASMIAHAAQFGFLLFVENPHIEKTYGSDSAHSRLTPGDEDVDFELPPARDLVGLINFDSARISDVALIIIAAYSILSTLLSSNSFHNQFWALFQAFLWRFLHSGLHGSILFYQSRDKAWSRHFIRNGESIVQAWSQWKGFYNITLNMSYISFCMAAWKLYHIPNNWTYGLVTLRHTLGFALIALHIYTSVSIYEDLGQYGWFYGDFFLPSRSPKLVYQGIYRYVNNPERFLGCSAYWGLALISNSAWIFLLATLAQLSNLAIIRLVEQPHMRKVYGNALRKEAGISKLIKQATQEHSNRIPKSIETHVKALGSTVDKVLEQTAEALQEFVNAAPPKVQVLLKGTESSLRRSAQLAILKLFAPQFDRLGSTSYSLKLDLEDSKVPLGSPIHVKWTAPLDHENNDWIGLYRVSDNVSDIHTQVSSEGRWSAIDFEGYNSHVSSIKEVSETKDSGEVVFSRDLLFWEPGTYEFRYHHSNKHLVMAKSQPFQIYAITCESKDVSEVENTLDHLLKLCIPEDSSKSLRDLSDSKAKTLSNAIKCVFGIELGHHVIQVDGSTKVLASRLVSAKKILQPFDYSEERKKDV